MAIANSFANSATRTIATVWINYNTSPPHSMTGRFAPSPTGRMHLGNAYSALLSWLSAKSQDSAWLLRIEDIDRQRSRREYADQIEDDLRWLGLQWDGFCRQSERSNHYEEALRQLQHQCYHCQCTRADLLAAQAPHESDGRVVYPGTCRHKGFTEGALRIQVPDTDIPFTDGHYGPQCVNLAHHCGDFVLRRRDGEWAYQLAVVVDDALTGVQEVVRGRDLLLSAAQQIFLHQALGYKPPQFTHLPLLCNAQQQRLSKRDSSLDLGALRQRYSAPQLIGHLAYYAGLLPKAEPITPEELIPLFQWNKIPTNNIIVNEEL